MHKAIVACVLALCLLGLLGGCLIVALNGFTSSGKRGEWHTFVPAPQAYIMATIMFGMSGIAFTWLLQQFNARALGGSPKVNFFDVVPSVTRAKIFIRDRYMCAYCAQIFKEHDLQAEHILPASKGGPFSWMNLVSACSFCNAKKSCRNPEEAGMPLVYLPDVPSRFEDFLLAGRHVRADVHDWLAARLPKGSRLS